MSIKQDMTLSGLTQQEALQRQTKFGKNILPSEKAKSQLSVLLEALSAPMTLLLVACAGVYLLLGDPKEGVLLSLGAIFTAGLDFFQTIKTQKALQALKSLTSPRALVIRDNQQTRISSQDLVPGDIIILAEGDRIPADAKLLHSSAFSVDESLLTGESLPVSKSAHLPGLSPDLFSGTLVLSGKGQAQVTETGSQSQIGKIGVSLVDANEKDTPLQSSLKVLIRKIFILSLVFLVAVVLLYGFLQKSWLKAFLLGLSTSISMIPEELPVVLTVFLAVGAWKMAQRRVLTRRVAALENLGAITALCVDKTGTLTENAMAIKKLSFQGKVHELSDLSLPELFHPLIEYGVLSSHRDPFDPMEKAIHTTLEKYLKNTEHSHSNWTLVKEYPLTDKLRAMACVWESPDTDRLTIAAKGAPEDIFDLCHLPSAQATQLTHDVHQLASEGLRVLGVAKSTFASSESLPPQSHDFAFEFLGLLGLEDPLRADVPEALLTCWKAGIRVFVLTGDYPATAKKIALQAGFPEETPTYLGKEIEALSDEQFETLLKTQAIFSRMSHANKLELVKRLQSKNQLVAMTGDGVNDAPSLKQADIGIAMGKRGTDVAREAADIILLDDNFSEIVTAVSTGRQIFNQIQTAMAYTFALHIPIGAVTLLPILMKLPILLEPIHLVFLELIIDPSCTIALSLINTGKDLMMVPPRKSPTLFFDSEFFKPVITRGLVGLLCSFAVPLALIYEGTDFPLIRSYTFLTLLGTILGILFGTLPRRLEKPAQNISWILVFGIGLFLTFLLFRISFLIETFHFSPISFYWGLLALAIGLIPCALTRFVFRN